ncbi:MAG TPA: hypothetical protein VNV18_00415 [Stellaceae bacterium]|jgi:hypothetical protein|nr:hypothetical protein [Stellaceae bacterium]
MPGPHGRKSSPKSERNRCCCHHTNVIIIFACGLLTRLAFAIYSQMPAQSGLGEQRREQEKVATFDEIGQEKQRIAERLVRLDSDRAKLAQQLEELEIAERVLSRFGAPQPGERRRRGRPARAAAAPAGERRPRATASRTPSGAADKAAGGTAGAPSLSDATLQAVGAHGEGATAAEVMTYLSRELGMSVRPNHLGIALQRHRRAGRLENRDSRWFLPRTAAENTQSAMVG